MGDDRAPLLTHRPALEASIRALKAHADMIIRILTERPVDEAQLADARRELEHALRYVQLYFKLED